MRRPAFLALIFALGAASAQAEGVKSARYGDPTGRYDHGILGDAIEHGTLELTTDNGRRLRIVLPETRVFEDTAPRVVDLDGDGQGEVVVVETDIRRGARLAVYGPEGLIAATPNIGRTHRWLAPIGAADLDGDGAMEIAYVDRPHLARLIRVWRFAGGTLELVGELPGYTNHAIGESDIAGGIRDCGQGPELIVADAGWRDIYAITMKAAGEFAATRIGPHQGRGSFAAALACE